MSQESFLRALDASLFGALANVGLADAAVYRALSDPYTPIDCNVVVDHADESAGELPAPVVGARSTVRLQASQVPSPVRGDTVTIGAVTYTLLEPVAREPGLGQVWTVRRG